MLDQRTNIPDRRKFRAQFFDAIRPHMIDLIISIAFSMAGALCLALLSGRILRSQVRWGYLLLALLGLLLYWILVVVGAEIQARFGPSGLHWNWLGKLFTIFLLLAAALFLPRAVRREAGLTLRMREGSVGPCLVAAVLLFAVSWSAETWAADGTDLSPERLLFQALMPGLDEEIFFRGYFLALLARAFDKRWLLIGAPLGPSAAIVTFVFAAGHGLGYAEGAVQFDAFAFVLTGLLGFGLLWIRQRSGSVLPAVIAHNMINLGNSFF